MTKDSLCPLALLTAMDHTLRRGPTNMGTSTLLDLCLVPLLPRPSRRRQRRHPAPHHGCRKRGENSVRLHRDPHHP